VGHTGFGLEYFQETTALLWDCSFKLSPPEATYLMLGSEGLWLWQETFVLNGQSELSLHGILLSEFLRQIQVADVDNILCR